ncbi:dihydrodipicolinate synthase family protein [Chimaeribacter californicus]|uniref:Dihydrodipicolinate synthase family protein n=1 Tax=Chimaeribacter californicus TaxID=2060067 RepID=A0A2N5E273_9GAMM|nr:dihydrodipicolinate synthase family protein [Chimaeribacter californicus]PLR34674.1 dihydrodipicolinate synthase family protein [Chimaeribacter californicus]
MFKGLSAFPLTPFTPDGDIDEAAFLRILERLVSAEVDSLGVLGSTGSYAYLTREQRKRVATLAKAQAGAIPMMVSVGAISTRQVLDLADDAQHAGADGLLLPAMSYQTLTEDEVYELFDTVSRHVSVPVCVYDNPGTTHFTFSDELHGRIAALPRIGSIKIPGVPADPAAASARVQQLRKKIPASVTIGVSGDAFAGLGLNAGCDVWYSVCGGLFPHTAKAIAEAAARGDNAQVTVLTERLAPLWALFRRHGGSIRVMAAAAGILGLTGPACLPRPLKPLSAAYCAEIATVVEALGLR